MFRSQDTGDGDTRRGTRARKVAKKVATVTDSERQQAVTARLNALESDNAAVEEAGAASDDEFDVDGESEDERSSASDQELHVGRAPKKRKKGDKRSDGKGKKTAGGKRKTRGMAEAKRRPRNFASLLEEANLDALPPNEPSYLTAAVGPPRTTAPRHFCSVCGNFSSYKCTRCGARFCSKKCNAVHTETRCLKFAV